MYSKCVRVHITSTVGTGTQEWHVIKMSCHSNLVNLPAFYALIIPVSIT